MDEIYSNWRNFGIRLKQIMDISGCRIKDLAEQTCKDMEFGSIESAKVYISMARSGKVKYPVDNPGSYSGRHRRRMAKFLSALGVDEDDEIVTIVRGIDPGFEYPPDGERHAAESDNTLFYDKLSRLKPQDLKLLEKLVSKILNSYSEI